MNACIATQHHQQTTPGLPGVCFSAGDKELHTRSVIGERSATISRPEEQTRCIEQAAVELWRPIPKLEGYEASSWGRIRSLDRYLELMGRWGPMTRFHRGRVLRLKPKPNGAGLYYLCFYADGGVYIQVNRAVCLAFYGEPPSEEYQAAHLDGRTENNRPENLAWKTPTENAADKVRHGTAPIGVNNARARLNEVAVADIIRRYADGEKAVCLADDHPISTGTVLAVVRGDIWTHVECAQRELARRRCRKNMLEASARANAQRRLHAQN